MRISLFPAFLLLGLTTGCATQSASPAAAPSAGVFAAKSVGKSIEVLDERTGMTLATLKEPIELLPSVQSTALAFGKRTSFAYLGPVEWNRMGTISYGLWIHIAPGSDRQAGDIHTPGAVTLILDDGPITLSPIASPGFGRDAYQQVVSWGQKAYFDLTVEMLRRIAASRKIELDVHAVDESIIDFTCAKDVRATLTAYMLGRGITAD
jgi:hypothetical protein